MHVYAYICFILFLLFVWYSTICYSTICYSTICVWYSTILICFIFVSYSTYTLYLFQILECVICEIKAWKRQTSINMAVLNSCLCCSLLTGSILTGITSTVLYLMSFALELWWIVDAGGISNHREDVKEYRLPIPAYVLALSYFR